MFKMLLKVFLLVLTLTNIYCVNDFDLVCYWRRDTPLSIINPSYLCTQILYSFVILDPNTLLMRFTDSSQEIPLVKNLTDLKKRDPYLKIIPSLGGWDDSAGDKYSRMVSNSISRANFVRNAVQFLNQYSFDGLDIDWEAPVCWQTDCSTPHVSDKANFASLLKELKTAFANQSNLTLSVAVVAGQWLADQAYDYTALDRCVDYINVMTYNKAGLWSNGTDHGSDFNWTKNTMNWWAQRVYKTQLLMGVPFFGTSFTLRDPNQHGIGAPFTSSSYLTYLTICNNVKYNGWTKQFINPYGPIAYKGNQWVGYDDTNQTMQKAQWVRQNGFGGLFIWELNQDDVNGACCKTKKPLLNAANYGLFQEGANPNTYQCE